MLIHSLFYSAVVGSYTLFFCFASSMHYSIIFHTNAVLEILLPASECSTKVSMVTYFYLRCSLRENYSHV